LRTFILRARKGSTRPERIKAQIGKEAHFEVVAHALINAFFVSNGFRQDVEMYVVLDSSEDFPRTLKFSEGISFSGFHELAMVEWVEKALRESSGLKKDETRVIAPGLEISGFGFERLVGNLLGTRPIYVLEPKGEDIRGIDLEPHPVFLLSDHLAMPAKTLKSFKRQGLRTLSLGKQMLFASQCVTLIHYELDQRGALEK